MRVRKEVNYSFKILRECEYTSNVEVLMEYEI